MLNSRLLMFDFDRNRNRKFEKEEEAEFIKTHFLTLKESGYNLFIELDGSEAVIEPVNVKTEFIKGRVVLSFETKVKKSSAMTLCTIDPTLYMAFVLKDTKSSYKLEIQKSEFDYCIGKM